MNETQLKDRYRDSKALNPPLEGNYFHDYFRQLPFNVLRDLLQRNQIDLTNKTVHVAACGRGLDVLHLSRLYEAKFWVTDIAPEYVVTALRNCPGTKGKVEDMEHLSFADDTFDWSFVGAGLHHLPRPTQGLYELLRVSREGAIFIEPHDSWLVRLFVSLGLAQEREAIGNYVYRWSRRDIQKVSKSLFYRYDFDTLFAVHRVAKTRLEFEVLRKLNQLANILTPRLGNYVICCLVKTAGERT